MTQERVPGTFEVLMVCTANICRSPMAEGLLRAASPQARVSSAGFLREGSPAAPDAVRAVRELGADIAGHRSRVVAPSDVEAADLVLTMERQHARELIMLVPEARDRVFTIRSFASALQRMTPLGVLSLEKLLHELNQGRSTNAFLGQGPDDLPDPYGRHLKHFRATAEELERHTALVAHALESASRAELPGGAS